MFYSEEQITNKLKHIEVVCNKNTEKHCTFTTAISKDTTK